MQFKLTTTYRYWWPVTVQMPDPERHGQILEQRLKVLFEPLPQADVIAAQEESASLKSLRDITDHGMRHMVRVVKGWDGVVDDDGSEVAFSTSALATALQHAWFRSAINRALTESQNGEAARVGN